MENSDNERVDNAHQELTDHDLMLSEVYQDDVELLYLDCCLGELIKK